MIKNITIILLTLLTITILAQNKGSFNKAKVNYDGFEVLVKEVKKHRAKRLISLNQFIKMNTKSEFIILDTRSEKMYKQKHIKGAIHLNFSDFNQFSLLELLPDPEVKILIYCNNNIEDDPFSFMTKAILPKTINKNIKEMTLALNIPTYINLYGYGYRNVYELAELISVNDKRIEFEGTEVLKQNINN